MEDIIQLCEQRQFSEALNKIQTLIMEGEVSSALYRI